MVVLLIILTFFRSSRSVRLLRSGSHSRERESCIVVVVAVGIFCCCHRSMVSENGNWIEQLQLAKSVSYSLSMRNFVNFQLKPEKSNNNNDL